MGPIILHSIAYTEALCCSYCPFPVQRLCNVVCMYGTLSVYYQMSFKQDVNKKRLSNRRGQRNITKAAVSATGMSLRWMRSVVRNTG